MGQYSTRRGKLGEKIAADHLVATGYQIIGRNYRGGQGEIDIIARKKGIVYFVEVKTRKQDSLVSPAESVTPAKKRRLKSAVLAWLSEHGRLDTPCSFLLIMIELPEAGRPKIEVVEDYLD
jgi:putative endonuclease